MSGAEDESARRDSEECREVKMERIRDREFLSQAALTRERDMNGVGPQNGVKVATCKHVTRERRL